MTQEARLGLSAERLRRFYGRVYAAGVCTDRYQVVRQRV